MLAGHSVSTTRSHLASRVPQLQPDCPVFEIHGFAEKIDANCGLVRVVKGVVHKSDRVSVPACSLEPSFTTYRVIRLVFPTLWSPNRTILVRLGGEEGNSEVVGDAMAVGGDKVRPQWLCKNWNSGFDRHLASITTFRWRRRTARNPYFWKGHH